MGAREDVSREAAIADAPAPRRVAGAVVGVLAAGVALGTAELLAAVVGPGSSPIVAVGGAAVDASPEWLKSFAISTFGERDKLALLVGIGVVLAIAVAVVGAASWRRPRLGIAASVVLGAIGAAAAVTRPANGVGDAIPSIVGAAAGVVAYGVLRTAAGLDADVPADRSPTPSITGYDRRRFLRTGVAAAGVTIVAGGLGRLLTSRATAADSRANTRIPSASDSGTPAPAGADLGVQGVSPFVTPNRDFYRVDTALFVPAIDAETWTLRVHGMVDREIALDFDDLLARQMIERDVTIACVSNEVGGPYVGNARWSGVPLADLLREANVHPEASQIVSRSADGFTIGTPTAVVMDGRDAMLAVSMNGEPLPLEHGFPVRMIVPGLYGYVSATKWLVDLELTTLDAYDAYWIQRGWAKEAPIKTQSRIDTPRSGANLEPGVVAVGGVAWAQHRGIERVEVRIDDGSWEAADLGAEDTVDTWRQWVYRWSATTGSHTIAVRATDGDGETQTADLAEPFPDGATGHHTIEVDVS
jgi:DMSO/TMAO reductase YedYZ molybdopterin-dependent catalytic subunit